MIKKISEILNLTIKSYTKTNDKNNTIILSDFINYLNSLYLNSIGTKKTVKLIRDYITETSDRQEAILDFLVMFNSYLLLSNLDTDLIKDKIKNSLLIIQEHDMFSEELRDNLSLYNDSIEDITNLIVMIKLSIANIKPIELK